MPMNPAPTESSNRARVWAALLGVGLVIAWTFVVYGINQANQPQPQQTVRFDLRKPVADAAGQRLKAWRLTGQHDPSMVRGLSGKMKPGMSDWYPSRDQVRISTPGGCTLWIKQGKVVSATKKCLR